MGRSKLWEKERDWKGGYSIIWERRAGQVNSVKELTGIFH